MDRAHSLPFDRMVPPRDLCLWVVPLSPSLETGPYLCIFCPFIGFLGFAANKWHNAGTPGRLDWGEQVIVITGGSSGIGALLANTLALRHCTVAVLDTHPIETESSQPFWFSFVLPHQ